jgi:hypothetical protein
MSLDSAALQDALLSLFSAPPATALECAAAWADAMRAHATGIVPPSTTVDAACSTLEGALAAAFATPAAAALVDAAFAAFALALGLGMAPLYTATPPPAILGIGTLLATSQPTHDAAATAFGALIDAWLRTGTATLVAPPNTVVPWT